MATKNNNDLKKDKQKKILVENILDKYHIYLKYKKSICTNFLNPSDITLIISYLNFYHIPYSIYEPYSFLEKKIIYFGEYQNFVTFYQIIPNNSQMFSHSELLGSLFAIGLEENTIGDILIQDDVCYYTNLTRLNSYLEEYLIKVGKQRVILKKIDELNLIERKFEKYTILPHSMRADNIISKISFQSRNQVKQMFSDKKIFLNYQELKRQDTILKEEDILSIRKIGKFRIGKRLGKTKKENIILEIYQYK